jgi:hypothetical protein
VDITSGNVLGTFENLKSAREAVRSALEWPGYSVHDVVVYVSDDAGEPVEELGDQQLAEWAGLPGAEPGGARNPLAVAS